MVAVLPPVYSGYPEQRSECFAGFVFCSILPERNGEKRLSETYEKVMITDLSGIKRDRPQLDLLKSISTKMEIWFDPGTR